jgi:hypothetical protein
MSNIKTIKDRYEEKGQIGLSYSDMNILFNLENEVAELKLKLKFYEKGLKQVAESDTLESAKRIARITLD